VRVVEQAFQQFWQFLGDWDHHQGFWVMVGAVAGAASAVVIFAAVLVARSQLREAQALRENQIRPFVVIEFHPEPTSVIYLRISNLGSTMARDVRFSVKPPLETTHEAQWHIMDLQLFQSGIRSLAPGRVIEFFFDTWIGRNTMNGRHEVTITYRGQGDRIYTDVLDLDLGVFVGMHFIRRYGLHDIHKQLEEIAGTLKNFKAWGGGLLSKSPADVAKEEEEWTKDFEAQRLGKDRASDPAVTEGASEESHAIDPNTSGA
jgi:hypothetical protein